MKRATTQESITGRRMRPRVLIIRAILGSEGVKVE